MEERLSRIEDMLAQLISMVGGMRTEQTAMKEEQSTMKLDLTTMKEDQSTMKSNLTAMKDDQSAMKEDQSTMKSDLTAMKEEQQTMRSENEERHIELISRFESLEADHEHTWQKAVRNEREIAKIKHQFEL